MQCRTRCPWTRQAWGHGDTPRLVQSSPLRLGHGRIACAGIIPYCATFTIFTDYMRGAIRIAALSQAGTIFVTTHDSIAAACLNE